MAGQISTKLEVYEGGGALPDSIKGAVLAIGNFDGLHRGHRVLLDTVVERARAGGRKAAVMLFEPTDLPTGPRPALAFARSRSRIETSRIGPVVNAAG